MNAETDYILTINGGSSTIKFAFYKMEDTRVELLHGKIDRIGFDDTTLAFSDDKIHDATVVKMVRANYSSAVNFFIDWLVKQPVFAFVKAVGHRVVHGMKYSEPVLVTFQLLKELHQISRYDPDHLPNEIKLMEIFNQRYPQLPQVACFDTAFHSTMPRVARLLPVPRRFDRMGIQRYGFHGLSFTYLMEELTRVAGKDAALGRVILAHIGNGVSLAAVKEGKGIDTSMGFTPASGLLMGTRSGDLDPGLAFYMMQVDHLTPIEFNNLISHECGLLGVSETTSDMRDLLALEIDDVRAREAVALFCYQLKKSIGTYAAVLGGIDTLVFAGGIGENSAIIRSRICDGLKFLGIEIDEKENRKNGAVISKDNGHVVIRVISTNEGQVIARSVMNIINKHNDTIKTV